MLQLVQQLTTDTEAAQKLVAVSRTIKIFFSCVLFCSFLILYFCVCAFMLLCSILCFIGNIVTIIS